MKIAFFLTLSVIVLAAAVPLRDRACTPNSLSLQKMDSNKGIPLFLLPISRQQQLANRKTTSLTDAYTTEDILTHLGDTIDDVEFISSLDHTLSCVGTPIPSGGIDRNVQIFELKISQMLEDTTGY